MMKTRRLISFVTHLVVWCAATGVSGAELKQGRYVGWITLTDREERVAVVTDVVLEQPKSYREFPRLKAVFKLSLGGYNTHEYLVESFEEIQDSGQGVLTFNEFPNDLTITAEVKAVGTKTVFKGAVFVRSAATNGTIELVLEDDEPEDKGPENEASDGAHPLRVGDARALPFIPLLEGQYEGTCELNQRAALQIQTVRGLKTKLQEEKKESGLGRYYGITARIIFKNDTACGELGANEWCKKFDYDAGSYNFYLGKLNLHGHRASDACSVNNGQLKCRVRIQGRSIDCEFKKTKNQIQPARFYTREFNVKATADQLKELPPPFPPENRDLNGALNGLFFGYLHNETNDRYQIVRLNVGAFSSDLNPMHNPTGSMIGTDAAIHLGRTMSNSFVVASYARRASYWVPGFTLNDPASDSYIFIHQWRQGYILGSWYSHSFGRVGTVQLVKGMLPPIAMDAKFVPSFDGEFEGPVTPNRSILRWFKLLFPTEPTDVIGSVIRFNGSHQSLVGVVGVLDIERGAFDPFTGRFGWILSNGPAETFTSGFVEDENRVQMHWPPVSDVFGVRATDYGFEEFARK